MHSVNVTKLQIYFDDGVRSIGKKYNAFPVCDDLLLTHGNLLLRKITEEFTRKS